MRRYIILCSTLTLAACNSTPPANNITGSWRSLNEFPSQTTEIPLIRQHYYMPLRIDVTLKTMLNRWAKESNMTLQYNHVSDYTVHTPVATIRQPNLDAALSELEQIYAPQGLRIFSQSGQIVVQNQQELDLPKISFNQDPSTTKSSTLLATPPLPLPPPLPIQNTAASSVKPKTGDASNNSNFGESDALKALNKLFDATPDTTQTTENK